VTRCISYDLLRLLYGPCCLSQIHQIGSDSDYARSSAYNVMYNCELKRETLCATVEHVFIDLGRF